MWALAKFVPAPAFWFTSYLAVVPRLLFAAARGNMIVVASPLPAAAIVVRRRYLILLPRPFPAAPRRCNSRRRTTRQMYSGVKLVLPAKSNLAYTPRKQRSITRIGFGSGLV